MDKELKEIIEKYINCNRKNIFFKYKKEILLLKENSVPLKGILEYLFKKDEELKKDTKIELIPHLPIYHGQYALGKKI